MVWMLSQSLVYTHTHTMEMLCNSVGWWYKYRMCWTIMPDLRQCNGYTYTWNMWTSSTSTFIWFCTWISWSFKLNSLKSICYLVALAYALRTHWIDKMQSNEYGSCIGFFGVKVSTMIKFNVKLMQVKPIGLCLRICVHNMRLRMWYYII